MAIAHEGLPGESTVSRRRFIAGVGAAGLTLTVGAVLGKSITGGEKASTNSVGVEAPVYPTQAVSVVEVSSSIDNLPVQSADFFANDPDANPNNLIGRTPEQKRAVVSIPMTKENLASVKVLAREFSLSYEKLINAGLTPLDAKEAAAQGYQIDLDSSEGADVGDLGDYILKEHIDDMQGGLFVDSYQDWDYSGPINRLRQDITWFDRQYQVRLLPLGYGVGTADSMIDVTGTADSDNGMDVQELEPINGDRRFAIRLIRTFKTPGTSWPDVVEPINMNIRAIEGADNMYKFGLERFAADQA